MIEYLKEYKMFRLTSFNTEYIIFIDERGLLLNGYFGPKMNTYDFEYYLKTKDIIFGNPLENANPDVSNKHIPQEVSTVAKLDYRTQTVFARRADGSVFSRYSYVSHEIKEGEFSCSGLPHPRKADSSLSILLKDNFSNVYLKLNYSTFKDVNVISRNIEIINKENDSVRIERAYSFNLDFMDNDFDITGFFGDWARERHPERISVPKGYYSIESTVGRSGFYQNPFVMISRKDTSEKHGECFEFSLLYTGNFKFITSVNDHEQLRISGGINDYLFNWELKPNETFTTPVAVMSYSNDGFRSLSITQSDFYRNYIINPNFVNRTRPIVINNWEATTFNFDEEKLKAFIDKASIVGVDTFVLDDGWFGHRDSDSTSLGDWFVYEKKLPNGLKGITDYCKEKGMRFGLWFEPEMISEDSELYKAHPDWIIGRSKEESSTYRNQYVLDFSNPEIVDYIYKSVNDIISNNDIDYVKWDFNRDISEYFSNFLSKDNQVELAHRFVLGFYDLAERLTSSHPNILFEGCSSGGARFDGGMLYYFPQIWTSDDTDAYERSMIQYGTSYAYPLSAMSSHVSDCPNWQTNRTTPYESRMRIASFGPFGYELDITKMTDEELELTRKQIIEYKRTSSLVLEGDFYRLSDPFKTWQFGGMIVSKDKEEAYCVFMNVKGEPSRYFKPMLLDGLNPDYIYEIEELSLKASGMQLMNRGVIIRPLEDYKTTTYHIRRI